MGASLVAGLETNIWLYSKNSGKYGELPSRGVKVGFRAVSRPLVGWDRPKTDPEWSRTLPGASQTPWDPDSLDFLAQIPILTLSSTRFDYK